MDHESDRCFFYFGDLCSTKESSMLNLVMTVFHVVFFGFIIIAGFYNGSLDNLVKPNGLAPHGIRNIIDGAAVVYFGYIGYDSASTMAEEIQNPSKSLPLGIVGSVVITSVIYSLMSLSLCLMVPYYKVSILNLNRTCVYIYRCIIFFSPNIHEKWEFLD